MSNQLKMATIQAVLALHAEGWSGRRIAEELGLDRGTVSRHLQQASSKPATAPPGSDAGLIKPPESVSACEPWRTVILERLELGLSAKRIHQDLVAEHGAKLSYHSVRRFAARLSPAHDLPFRRMECEPGAEAQVDFGTGAPVITADGKRRRPHVFRVVLSHSRKGYSEASSRQTTEDFIRCLENTFWAFGGVPRTLVIDNLRAAVSRPDWFDPLLNPKLQSFCQHYGVVILPTRPYTPRHKGKIERGIGYVKGNALKGRTFESVEAQNGHLAAWESSVADTRIHGTTKRQVKQVFEQVERSALLPLPRERFPFFHEEQRAVHRDGHVEVAKAYYSVPPEYLGRKLWVRWDARLVRIFNSRMEQVALHARQEAGRFSTLGEHVPSEKISGVERGSQWLLMKARAWASTRAVGAKPCWPRGASRGFACCRGYCISPESIRVTPSSGLARPRSAITPIGCRRSANSSNGRETSRSNSSSWTSTRSFVR